MNIEGGIALNTLSIIYMIILIINMWHKRKWESLNRRYCQITIVICVFLALDILYMLFYGRTELYYRILLKIVKSVYFLVNSLIVWLWVRYIDFTVFEALPAAGKHPVYYHIVLAVNTLLVFVNAFTGILFDISEEGTFLVASATLWIFTALNYSSIVVAIIVLIRNKGRVDKKSFLPLLIFSLPPLCAELIQIFYRPFSLLCAYAVSALIIFQVSQNNTIYTDELTGLANRRMLNETLHKWFSDPKGLMVCGLMIDLDGLKQINDTYGHVSGDNALFCLAGVIKSVKQKDIIAARYGGDEFMMVWLSRDGHEISEVENELVSAKAQLNSAKSMPERIEFSVGRFCVDDNGGLTAEDFVKEIDDRMYESKKEKKQTAGQ